MRTPTHLTESERSTYQSLLARGYTHNEALNDALDGVQVDDVRRAVVSRPRRNGKVNEQDQALATRALKNPDEADTLLRAVTDEGLIRCFAALTHRMHATRRDYTLRIQRDRVEKEMLRRMKS